MHDPHQSHKINKVQKTFIHSSMLNQLRLYGLVIPFPDQINKVHVHISSHSFMHTNVSLHLRKLNSTPGWCNIQDVHVQRHMRGSSHVLTKIARRFAAHLRSHFLLDRVMLMHTVAIHHAIAIGALPVHAFVFHLFLLRNCLLGDDLRKALEAGSL